MPRLLCCMSTVAGGYRLGVSRTGPCVSAPGAAVTKSDVGGRATTACTASKIPRSPTRSGEGACGCERSSITGEEAPSCSTPPRGTVYKPCWSSVPALTSESPRRRCSAHSPRARPTGGRIST